MKGFITIKRKKNSQIYRRGSSFDIMMIREESIAKGEKKFNYFYYADNLQSLKFSPEGANGNLCSFIDVENYQDVKEKLMTVCGCDTLFPYQSSSNNPDLVLLGNILRESYMSVAINKREIYSIQYVCNDSSINSGYIRLTFLSGESIILVSGIDEQQAKSITTKIFLDK